MTFTLLEISRERISENINFVIKARIWPSMVFECFSQWEVGLNQMKSQTQNEAKQWKIFESMIIIMSLGMVSIEELV